MKIFVVATTLLIAPCLSLAQQPNSDAQAIQGSWRGTSHGSMRAKHFVLVFCGDALVGVNLRLGSQESTFRLNEVAGTIDIEREDGLQLGTYTLEADKLSMILGDVNQPRPGTRESRGYNKSSYVFERER